MKKTKKEIIVLLGLLLLCVGLILFIFNLYKYFSRTNVRSLISWEMKFKDIIKKQLEFESTIIEKKRVNDSVQSITEYLESHIDENPYDVEILIIDSPIINALTFPGGLMVVYTGLIKITDNPEELATIIAHELGHVINRDSMSALIRQFGIAMLFTVVTGGDAGIIESIIRNIINNRFTNEMEKKADEFAFELMEKAKIDPIHYANVFTKLKEKQNEYVDEKILKYIGDHPTMNSRIEKAKGRSEAFYGKEHDFNIDWDEIKRSLPSLFNNI